MSDKTRPVRAIAAITKSDTVDITKWYDSWPRGIYVGTGGDVAIVTPDGVAVTHKNVASGSYLPIEHRRVNSTNTTASDMVAWY